MIGTINDTAINKTAVIKRCSVGIYADNALVVNNSYANILQLPGYILIDSCSFNTALNQYPVIYYRVKLTTLDGEVKYSNIVKVSPARQQEIKAWPNPFSSYITMNITVDQNTVLGISLKDAAGKSIRTYKQPAARGVNQLTISNLDNLANGIYMIEVADEITEGRKIMKFVKER